jgi:hypothetical protein
MKTRIMKLKILGLAVFVIPSVLVYAAPFGTGFTYQGQLTTSNGIAQGNYDFNFSLFDAPSGGNRIGSVLNQPTVGVSNGLFAVLLDFGAAAFLGDARWLAIEVRPAGSQAAYATLLPRQPISPAPSALFAAKAAAVVDGVIGNTSLQNNSVTANKIGPGQVVKSLNGLTDAVSLVAGANVTLNTGANSITISGLSGFTLPYAASLLLDGTTVGKTLLAISNTAPSGYSDGIAGYTASSDGSGLHGWATGTSGNNKGVFGRTSSPDGNAVRGENLARNTIGLLGSRNEGVFGQSDVNGVFGQSLASFDGSGVLGRYDGSGLFNGGNGVFGYNATVGVGVLGVSEGGDGISGRSNAGGSSGVFGYTERPNSFGGFFVNASAGGTALVSSGLLDVRGEARMNDRNIFLRGAGDLNHGIGWHGTGKLWAGVNVDGPVVWGWAGGALGSTSTGQRIALSWDAAGEVKIPVLTITGGSDLAEPFPLASEEIKPGSVVIIDEEHAGQLKLSERAYDTRVAGIVSGANGVNTGLSLRQQGVLEGGKSIALSGRVYVQADDSNGPIKPGDLLTTSAVPGHAMRVADSAEAQGAVLGKAMSSLAQGRGWVLVLVTLQ